MLDQTAFSRTRAISKTDKLKGFECRSYTVFYTAVVTSRTASSPTGSRVSAALFSSDAGEQVVAVYTAYLDQGGGLLEMWSSQCAVLSLAPIITTGLELYKYNSLRYLTLTIKCIIGGHR